MNKKAEGFIQRFQQARAMEELKAITGFHISLANTAIKSHFQQNFGDLRLTQKQIAFLWLVDGCPGIVQSELALLLGVTRATVSAMVDVLERRGYVLRASSSVDRRRVPLKLTSDGVATLKRARSAIDEHERWVNERFSPAQLNEITTLMQMLYEETPGSA